MGSYWNHRRIWVQKGEGNEILVASHTNKNWFYLKKEIDEVKDYANLPEYEDREDTESELDDKEGDFTLMDLASLSSNLLLVSFIAYLVATLFFGGAVKGAKSEATYKNSKWGTIAIVITIIGFLTHLGYFITRWIASGHAPLSNMFEFTTAFAMMLVGAFILLFYLYRTPSLGLFALPIAIIIIGYASMFPTEITPLIPALKSYWLWVHVSTAALGEAILAISAVAGLVLLLKNVDLTKKSKSSVFG